MNTQDPGQESPQAYARLPHCEREFLDQSRAEPMLGSLSVAKERVRMRRGHTARLQEYPVDVLTSPVMGCPVTIVRPRLAGDGLPILLFLHGGG